MPSHTAINNSTRQLPRPLVWTVLSLCVLPIVLNLIGVRFDARNAREGLDVYTILEWSAFCVALTTVVLGFVHYFIRDDVTTPIITSALFVAGLMDGFQTLAANQLIPKVADNQLFIPFTWAISQLFFVVILVIGASLFLGGEGMIRSRNRGTRFVLLMGILFALVAYSVIHACAAIADLPQTVFPEKPVPRPWDAAPLVLLLFAGGIILPRFCRKYPSQFAHGLLLSVVPQIVAQTHIAFGSTELFDNHFNIAHFLKIVAYLIPLTGLILDYTRAWRAEATLHTTQEKLRIAREVQMGLFPAAAPEIDGVDLAGVSYPADAMGGDYYDFFPLRDDCLCVVVADVSGHDLAASTLMAQTRAYLHALVRSQSEPSEIATELNRFICDDVRDTRFVTMFLATLNPSDGTLKFSGAGHNGFIVSRDQPEQELGKTGPVLGVVAGEMIKAGPPVQLRPGDIFVCFTDGIVEAESLGNEQFGTRRALDVVFDNHDRSAREIVDTLYEEVRKFCGYAPQGDDITAMVIKVGCDPGSSKTAPA